MKVLTTEVVAVVLCHQLSRRRGLQFLEKSLLSKYKTANIAARTKAADDTRAEFMQAKEFQGRNGAVERDDLDLRLPSSHVTVFRPSSFKNES
jgi:hypothetical protein